MQKQFPAPRHFTNPLEFLLIFSLSNPKAKQNLTQHLTGYILNNILQIRSFEQILKIQNLVTQINSAVESMMISPTQRSNIYRKVLKNKYKNVDMFEQTLFDRIQEQRKNKYHDEQSLSLHEIQQVILKQEQEEARVKLKLQQETQRLARELQLKQQILLQQHLLHKQVSFQCPICLEQISIAHQTFFQCQHSFHRECISKYFKESIKNRNFPLRCPSCNGQCTQNDLRQCLQQQDLKRHQQFTFQSYVKNKNEDMSWCPSPGCQYVFFFTEEQHHFNCPICREEYCLKCKVKYHKGMDCKEFSVNRVFDDNDVKFVEFVKGAKYKQCPNCSFWVEKVKGCNHMTCRCKFEFCYQCGVKYGTCGCKASLFGHLVAPRTEPPSLFAPRTEPSSLFAHLGAPRPTIPSASSLFSNSSANISPSIVHDPLFPSNLKPSQLPKPLSSSELSYALFGDHPFKTKEKINKPTGLFGSNILPPLFPDNSSGSLFGSNSNSSNSLFTNKLNNPINNGSLFGGSLFGNSSPSNFTNVNLFGNSGNSGNFSS